MLGCVSKLVKEVTFYNHFGAGDVFESREFVKDWMDRIPDTKFYYAHGKDSCILADMPELEYREVTEVMEPMTPIKVEGDSAYINTWIGRDGRYVLPGIGCVVEQLYEMHTNMMISANLEPLRRNIYEYIPKIDFLYYKTGNIDKFISGTGKSVLISNGPVQSNQAFNFEFDPVLSKLCELRKDVLFMVTQSTGVEAENLVDTSSIIQKDRFDLNEVAYLSKHVSLVVGRNSGPHVYTQFYDNWSDPSKVSLSFTYKKCASHFVHTDALRMQKMWSDVTETSDVVYKICEAMERAGI